MRLLRDTNWEEIFEEWEKGEASDPGWVECATKVKGWPDWKSWRGFTGGQWSAKQRKWKLYEIENPMEEIPAMLVRPYGGWQSRHPDSNKFDFRQLLEIEKEREFWDKHKKIRSLMAAFPSPTEFIGLLREDLGRVVCLEGHHRATAVTLAAIEGKLIEFGDTKPRIAMFDLPVGESGLLKEILRRGSNFEEPNGS